MPTKCPLCTVSSDLITSLLHLHSHCINAHPNEFYTCPWCTIPFGTIRALKDHAKNCSAFDRNQQREGEIFPVLVNGSQCWVCLGTFPSQEAAMHHYKEQHLYFSYICVECQQYFQRKSSLDDHYATCHAKAIEITTVRSLAANPSVTPTTSTTINRVRNPKRPALTAFGNPNCDAAATGPAAKKKKIMSKNASRNDKTVVVHCFNGNYCPDCEISFPTTGKTKEHFEIEHQTEVFVCNICSKGYLNEDSMYQHRLKCSKSDAEHAPTLTTKIRLKTASKTDKNVLMALFNRNCCVDCKVNFQNRSAIAEHFKQEHNINIFLCCICKKGYMTSSSLHDHRMREHKIKQKQEEMNRMEEIYYSAKTESSDVFKGGDPEKENGDEHLADNAISSTWVPSNESDTSSAFNSSKIIAFLDLTLDD